MFKTSKVILVSFGHFMHDVYSSFIAPFLPVLIKTFSLNYSQAAMLNVAFRAPSLINPFLGMIADRVNLKFFVIFGPLITAICMCFLAESPSYFWLVLLLLFCGTNVLLFHIPAPVMVKHLSDKMIGRGMSIYMLGGEGARFVGPILFVWAVSTLGLHRLYYLLLPVIFATFYLYWKLKDEDIKREMKHKTKRLKAHHSLRKHLSLIVGICGIYTTAGILKSSVTIFLPTYYTSLGNSLVVGGSALAIVQFFGALGVLCSGTLSDKLSKRKLLVATAISASVFLLGLNLSAYSTTLTVVCLVGLGLSIFANGPILLAVINSADKDNPAFINAVFMALNLGINSLMAFAAGKLFDLYGFHNTFYIASAINLLCLPFIILIKDTSNEAA